MDGLEIVLSSLAQDFKGAKTRADDELGKAQLATKQLDDLEHRVEALMQDIPVQVVRPSISSVSSTKVVSHQPNMPSRDWASICEEAETRLRERGIDPTSVSLDALLDPEEVARIERRFSGGFTLSTRLDSYDIAAAAAAGLTASLIDFLIVKIPGDIKYLGDIPQAGSLLTKWLHSLNVPTDNWLARYFKTAYDPVIEGMSKISGFGPKTHRLQTFGHDPLIGLVIGTIDIMRGGLTAISKESEIIWLNNTGTAHYNPFTALVWQVMHLLSDGFTKMGLPAPGWSLLQLFQVGSFGEKERTVADLARFMYLNGYDSRHFLTMSTSVAAVEVVLRGYFWTRRKLDEEYNADVAHAGEITGAKGTGDHPRFQAMALAAHATAAAANAGKVAIYAGNPLAINYAQWLRFFHATFSWMRTKMRSPSDVLKGHAYANWRALDQGWQVIDAADPSFPTLYHDFNKRSEIEG